MNNEYIFFQNGYCTIKYEYFKTEKLNFFVLNMYIISARKKGESRERFDEAEDNIYLYFFYPFSVLNCMSVLLIM